MKFHDTIRNEMFQIAQKRQCMSKRWGIAICNPHKLDNSILSCAMIDPPLLFLFIFPHMQCSSKIFFLPTKHRALNSHCMHSMHSLISFTAAYIEITKRIVFVRMPFCFVCVYFPLSSDTIVHTHTHTLGFESMYWQRPGLVVISILSFHFKLLCTLKIFIQFLICLFLSCYRCHCSMYDLPILIEQWTHFYVSHLILLCFSFRLILIISSFPISFWLLFIWVLLTLLLCSSHRFGLTFEKRCDHVMTMISLFW